MNFRKLALTVPGPILTLGTRRRREVNASPEYRDFEDAHLVPNPARVEASTVSKVMAKTGDADLFPRTAQRLFHETASEGWPPRPRSTDDVGGSRSAPEARELRKAPIAAVFSLFTGRGLTRHDARAKEAGVTHDET